MRKVLSIANMAAARVRPIGLTRSVFIALSTFRILSAFRKKLARFHILGNSRAFFRILF